MNNAIGRLLNAIGEYTLLIIHTMGASLRRPPSWPLMRQQLFDFGVLSLPVVAFTGLSTGMVLAAQSFFQLEDKGLASATGLMVGKAMLTELGPVLTAFMVTGRVGAAMCAELGTMQVTEQVDALRSMAVNPLRYLIAPRMIAGTLMLPLLTVFSCITGIFGGYFISIYFFNMSPNDYMDPIPTHMEPFDFFSGMSKALMFGLLISTISCYKGLTTKGGAEGVGRATTNSVVICYSCILLFNFLLTLAMNLLYDWFLENVSFLFR